MNVNDVRDGDTLVGVMEFELPGIDPAEALLRCDNLGGGWVFTVLCPPPDVDAALTAELRMFDGEPTNAATFHRVGAYVAGRLQCTRGDGT